ncbi:TonB-dependent receptor [Pedobacter gandavensis]|nr:TonB-dependent receptor [Pedobacter gandavensis]WGQ08460.1 TonB-dependent receptor [Pedobacter gandavensis]
MMKPYLKVKGMNGCGKSLFKWLMILLFFPLSLAAQKNKGNKGTNSSAETPGLLKGKITSIYGEPLFGVSVKNKTAGTDVISGKNGDYALLIDSGEVIVFSLKGYLVHEQVVTGNKLNMVLTEAEKPQSVVQRLYDTQKKSTSILSTESVYTKDLLSSPVTALNNALSGRLSGLSTLQSTGIPGLDAAGYALRGQDPTILVNGIPRDLISIDFEQIESVTVLKDALATGMLGLRGSGGAILITTKQGEVGKQKISFTAQTGLQSPVKLPKTLAAYPYANLYNEALLNDGKAPVYSSADLEAYRTGSDPMGHPNVDWYKEILRNNAPFTRYNLNTSGGGNNARYFLDVDYLDQQGLLKTSDKNSYNTNADFKRYIVRTNIDVDLTKNLTVNLNLFGRIENGNSPGARNVINFNGREVNLGVNSIFNSLASTPNGAYPMLNPDGSLGGNKDFQNNIYGQSTQSGYTLSYGREMSADVSFKRALDDVTKGLWLKGLVSFNTNLSEVTSRGKTFAVYQGQNGPSGTTYQRFGTDGTIVAGTSLNTYQYKNFYSELSAGYDRTFGNHHVKALANANIQNISIYSDLPLTYQTLAGSVAYDYKEKYLAEVVMSYSGLNRYPDNKRFGLFPTAGLGWNIAKESFIADHVKWLNTLKLRASYGRTGNANAGYFVYNQYFADGDGYYFGGGSGTFVYSVREQTLANPNITWEKANKLNLGIDLSLFNDKLTLTTEYYRNKYFDLLQVRGKNTAIIGNTYPLENIGTTNYTGLDFTASYRNHLNNFNYFVSGNLTANNKIIKYQDEVFREYDWMKRTGQRTDQVYGYQADGFYQNAADIANSPKTEGYNPVPGDIKYKDLNGDGVINQFDIEGLKNNKAIIYYGFSLGFDFKGFDFSALLQGAANRMIYLSGPTQWEFQNDGKGQAFEHHLDRWTPETAATATYPRLAVGSNPNNQAMSSFWLRSGNYMRLKNMEIGYTLPQRFAARIKLASVRFFANGMNLFTISDNKDIDPEVYGTAYPALRTINAGINIKL